MIIPNCVKNSKYFSLCWIIGVGEKTFSEKYLAIAKCFAVEQAMK